MEHFWPEKDGQWYTVRRGTPRFPGHDMPRLPLLGDQDEADPAVMRAQVELARGGGVEAGATLEHGSEGRTAQTLGFDSATAYQYCADAGQSGDDVVGGGTTVEKRSYWSDRNTEMTADLGVEAQIHPANWGTVTLEMK